MEKTYNFDFSDWGSWGVSSDKYCLYDEGAALQAALSSGEDFDTGWHGFKKELQSMRVKRDCFGLTVEVSAFMDSVYDEPELMFDCLTDEEERTLSDAGEDAIDTFIEDVRNDAAMLEEFQEEVSDDADLPVDASLEQVLTMASELMQRCDDRLKDSFRLCISASLYHFYKDKLPMDDILQLINERIAKLAPIEEEEHDGN